jgi:hypothetical protein
VIAAPPPRGGRFWNDRTAIAVALLWIPSVLWVDRSTGPAGQLALGAVTWALLLWWLAHESALVRAQTLVVVVIATAVEYVFSGALEVYVYRLEHVPAYVPPGHGLVYLAALAIGRSAVLRRNSRTAVAVTAAVAGAWAVWGVTGAERTDLLGLLWYVSFLGFLIWGRSTLLYVGAFVVVSYLELLGTRWGVWTWAERDTIAGLVPMGNPPSIAAGGYGWFDLYAVLLAPTLVRWWTGARRRRTTAAGAPAIVAATAPAGAQPDSSASAAECSSPLLATPLPRSGPSTPSSPVNRPPASVTTSDTPATS